MVQNFIADGFNDRKTSSSGAGGHGHNATAEALSCDLHAVTGNIMFCCKEISSFSSSYKLALDLSVSSYLLTCNIL